jgi:thiamine-monophosphate kinase
MLNEIDENRMISSLTGKFCRSPYQQNLIHESDAELLFFPDNSGSSIAVTIDSISEEISSGLYEDPYLIGWMIVMVNFSDIAAAGAKPLGILIAEIIPDYLDKNYIERIQNGINDAVNKCSSFVIGGDTNSGEQLILTGCALGKSIDKKYLKRKGCKPGDIIYSTGKGGRGNAFAITKFIKSKNHIDYFPEARIKESTVIRLYSECCIDTSDGFLSSLDQLMRLNDCGFIINNWMSIVDEEAIEAAKNANLPEWILLAGPHGEFELIFTISNENERDFLLSAGSINWNPVKLGYVTSNPGIVLNIYNRNQCINMKTLRNLPSHSQGDIQNYIETLMHYDSILRI